MDVIKSFRKNENEKTIEDIDVIFNWQQLFDNSTKQIVKYNYDNNEYFIKIRWNVVNFDNNEHIVYEIITNHGDDFGINPFVYLSESNKYCKSKEENLIVTLGITKNNEIVKSIFNTLVLDNNELINKSFDSNSCLFRAKLIKMLQMFNK